MFELKMSFPVFQSGRLLFCHDGQSYRLSTRCCGGGGGVIVIPPDPGEGGDYDPEIEGYGLFVLISGLCGRIEEEWPGGTIWLGPGIFAIPDKDKDILVRNPAGNSHMRFVNIGFYDAFSDAQLVADHWQDVLKAFIAGASTRLCAFGLPPEERCPGGWPYWPASGDVADFSIVGMNHEFDLSLIAGAHNQGTCPSIDFPGCFATYDVYVELYHEHADAAGILVGQFDKEELVVDPATDARLVPLSQDGQYTWTWSGTVTCDPCKCFAIRAWCWTTSHFEGSIFATWQRRDCPDMSEAGQAEWQAVLDALEDIPKSSRDLATYLRTAKLIREMGGD